MKFLTNILNALASRRIPVVFRSKPSVVNSPPSIPVDNKTVKYLLNDPSTPELIKQVTIPDSPISAKVAIKNYRGGGFELGTQEGQAASCMFTLSHVVNFVNQYVDKKMVNWSTTNKLYVNTRAGSDLNAYYDRQNLKFFYFTDKRIGTIYTCDSCDIVSHELGHAILDFYRPDMWNAASLEIAAFHEAFGDFISIMNSLSHDEICNYIINQTNGDLFKDNVVSNVAEQFGRAIHILSPVGTSPNCLRSAINNFKYVNPGTLPEDATSDKLSAECHSFSRIFLGTLYEIFVMIYHEEKNGGMSSLNAIHSARDTIMKYVMKSIIFAPLNVNFYESMARTILWSDVILNNRKYHDKIQAILFSRNLITAQVKMLSAPSCDNESSFVEIQSTMSLKLGDHFIRAQSDNPLYDALVEIPNSQAYLYDNDKNLFDSILVTENESLIGAQDMICYLNNTHCVGDDLQFKVEDGKLIRNHFI